MKPIHFLGILIVVIGYYLFKVFSPFIGNITIATLLALATYKIHRFLLLKFPGRILPALLSTIILGVLFFAPLIYIITNAATFVAQIDFTHLKQTITETKKLIESTIASQNWLSSINMHEYTAQLDVNKIINWLISTATFLGTKSANFIKDTLLILIFYFFANLYGKDLLQYFQRIIPLRSEDSITIFENLTGVMGVVFNSIIATAIFEGALFGIIAHIYGYNGLLFGILYGFSSLIPVVGGMLMWLPVSIDLYFSGNTSGAIVLALYSIIVISVIADTFIKPIIIKYIDDIMSEEEHTRVNELLIFFSIIAGLSSYGFWGMIIGPAVITLMISVLNLYPKLALKS
ncbi:AI-2E family transporter [Nitratiruptor tergarcus]|uniref:Predicted PurR-regulated permease PerM n=1 Tax=Nitratiruptor tergarcus DSM 16512 TaxID=1069081 RepID=A0A1W1WRT8_9BACT|nr:AI-2E family transporter [Nitratiruptor tergarcus]SMC09038.1 Predicted PurR-regulated permease PerM [Nitratiruptor tergarcus DSM 16512]